MNWDVFHLTALLGLFFTLNTILWNMPGPIELKIPFAYFLSASLAIGFWFPIASYSFLEIAMKLAALKFFVTLILLWLFTVHSSEKTKEYVVRFVLGLLLVDAVFIMFGGWGIFNVPIQATLDATIFAIFLPLTFSDKYLKWSIPVFIAAILHSKGTAAYGILVMSAFLISTWATSSRYAWSVFLILFSIVLYMALINPEFGGHRWDNVWREHVEYWQLFENQWFGIGLGGFEWFSPAIRPWVKHMGYHSEGAKQWLHGDFIQMLIEGGYVGLFMFSSVYLSVMWRLRQIPKYLITWLSLGAGMLVYSPIQFWQVQIIVAIIIYAGVRGHGD